ncbi:MAG: hypothetical protein QOC77_2072 [Thermoleophilaceae bacterium]|jgi:hypothetical protein|nr:hypothetical protein [Thermoleophilaceae bacterium]MEA2469046.1 hypothetical protein [Thermoleophilaceae bacterium]
MKRILLTLLVAVAAAASLTSGTAFAGVIQTADAERPISQDWASTSCASDSRVKQVTSPVAQGKRAYDVSLKDGDYSFGERCEIGMGNYWRPGFPLFHEGDERWISFQVYIPDQYPIDTKNWNVFFQIHQEGDGGCPPLALHIENGQYKLFNTVRNTYVLQTYQMWSAPAQANHWAKFTLHMMNSTSDSKGFIEMFGDLDGTGMKRLMDKTYTHTMTKYSNGKPMTNHARVGIYRDPAIRGDAHILFDGFTIATDRGSAEANAFAAPGATGAGSDPTPATPSAKRHNRVWLRTSGAPLHTAGSHWPRVVRVYGGVRPGRSAARRSVMIQMRYRGRWEWLARSWVHRNGRFYIAANIDPALTGKSVRLRAVVAGVGHSKPLTARI